MSNEQPLLPKIPLNYKALSESLRRNGDVLVILHYEHENADSEYSFPLSSIAFLNRCRTQKRNVTAGGVIEKGPIITHHHAYLKNAVEGSSESFEAVSIKTSEEDFNVLQKLLSDIIEVRGPRPW